MAKLTLSTASGTPTDSQYNADGDLIEAAIENTISRDGTSPNSMNANLDMNNFRITNLPEPTNGAEPFRLTDAGSWQVDVAADAAAAAASETAAAASASAAATSEANAAASEANVADLLPTTITSIAAGEVLKYSGSEWVNNTLTEAGIQAEPSEGAFADGDKTKLDGIETAADVTDATNVTAAGALMDSELTSIADVKALDQGVATTDSPTFANVTLTGNISDVPGDIVFSERADHASTPGAGKGYLWVKSDTPSSLIFTDDAGTDYDLSNVIANAVDVTGTPVDNQIAVWTDANTIEGDANFTWDASTLAITGAITVTGNVDGRDISADGTKLDGIEALADVTDTTNVTAAGALMDSELTDITAVKALNQGVATTDSPTFDDLTLTGSVLNIPEDIVLTERADHASTPTATKGYIWLKTATPNQLTFTDDTGTDVQLGAFVAADRTKLDGIEALADVTDTTNVTAAGALMDSELTSITDVKALDQSVVSGAAPTFTTTNFTDATNKRFMTDAQETKLDSVESSADVTDTANVTAAGALMDSELTDITAVKATSDASVSTVNTGTDTAAFVTPDALAGSDYGTRLAQVIIYDDGTTCATGDGAGDVWLTIPEELDGYNLVSVGINTPTAGTTGTMDVQIHNIDNALDMLSTKLTIDSGETDSATAATPAVINTSNDHVNTGDRLRFDVDAVHTTPATGLSVRMGFRIP